MTDKIPSFKEEIDGIHVPIDKLDAIIVNTVLGSVPKRKHPLRKKIAYSAAVAVAAVGLLIGSATVSPVMANIVSQIPIVGSIFSQSEDRGLQKISEFGLTEVVGQSQTINGNTVTIDEVFYDETRFTVSLSLESEKPIVEGYLRLKGWTIDGEAIASGVGIKEPNRIMATYHTWIYSIESYDTAIPGKFDLALLFEGGNGEQWEFSIPVVKQSDIEVVTIDHQQQVEGLSLTASSLQIGPGGILLKYQAFSKNYDSLASMVRFQVVDSLGNELIVHESGSTGRQFVYGKVLLEPADEKAKELTITPYLLIPKPGEWKRTDGAGNVTDVDVSQYQGLDIKFDSFTVKLP